MPFLEKERMFVDKIIFFILLFPFFYENLPPFSILSTIFPPKICFESLFVCPIYPPKKAVFCGFSPAIAENRKPLLFIPTTFIHYLSFFYVDNPYLSTFAVDKGDIWRCIFL